MILCFELEMPGRASRDGNWSGDGRFYAITHSFGRGNQRATDILAARSFGYSFGDGWHARVTVSEVDAKQAAAIRRKSAGFCGYDWMVDSILAHGEIRPR